MDGPNAERRMLPLKEVGRALVQHFGLTEGLWDVTIEFKLAAAAIGPTPDDVLPSAIASVSQIGLSRVDKAGPSTVDASTARSGT